MENLEKYRKEIFKDETSAGDEGIIAESVDVVNDKFGLNQEQMLQALNFLYSIKDSFLGRTKKEPSDNIVNELSSKIIKYLRPTLIVSEKEFKEEIDKLLLDYGLKIDMQEINPYEKIYSIYKEWQLEDDDNLFFNLKSVGMWIEWFKDSYKYIFDLHFSTIEKKSKGSYNIQIKIPNELKDKLEKKAEKAGVSLNQYIMYLFIDDIKNERI
ncbi:TPA: toxin-antitoxin system HicB family antitoxin [Campylobacter coli]